MKQQIELLAPAGSPQALHAAVSAGANAVYLGLDVFNARRGANNFTLENLADACDYAHLRGAKIYLTLNIAVLPQELDDALNTACAAYEAGVDAFIVQDLGVARELRYVLPKARLHISTQMNTHNVAGIRAAASLGAARVTLARELSLEEIAELSREAAAAGVEIETFAHGALCVCYSGQCFMSSLIGGRSANRGLCAQACRLPYVLHQKGGAKPLPAPGEHLLSPKDLCSVNLLGNLVRAGVCSLKIEGRMKSPEYVNAVVGVYRQVLDRVLETGAANAQVGATEAEEQALAEAFSRGFTSAYLTHERGNEIMSYGRPNNRGVFVGRVQRVKAGVAFVSSDVSLVAGDVLEFWTNKGHFAYVLDVLECTKDGLVCTRPQKAVGKGDRVFRVRSAQAAFHDDVRLPRVGVCGRVVVQVGKPLHMEFWLSTCTNVVGSADGPVVEAARTKALDASDVQSHVDRLGQTPFVLDNLEVELDPGAGMGFSTLHHVRSAALAKLQDQLLVSWHSRSKAGDRCTAQLQATGSEAGMAGLGTSPRKAGLGSAARGGSAPHAVSAKHCNIMALATNPACAQEALGAGASVVYIPALSLAESGQTSAGVVAVGGQWPGAYALALPVVNHSLSSPSRDKDALFNPWAYSAGANLVLAENFSQAFEASERGLAFEIGPHIPITNSAALGYAASLGAQRVWLSPELNLAQITELALTSPVPLGLYVSGAQELMTTEHCLLMSQGPCNQRCASCERRKAFHYLSDRKGYEFPVLSDVCGRSHLYNSVSLDIVHALPDLIRAGVSAFMVDTTLLGATDTRSAVQRAVRARDVYYSSGNALDKAAGSTSGHLFRGVL